MLRKMSSGTLVVMAVTALALTGCGEKNDLKMKYGGAAIIIAIVK